MTDRHAGYVVTLDRDIREDDAEAILNAIRMIKHVASVEPVIADLNHQMAVMRASTDLHAKLWSVLKPYWAKEAEK
jgi:hypothetical protein